MYLARKHGPGALWHISYCCMFYYNIYYHLKYFFMYNLYYLLLLEQKNYIYNCRSLITVKHFNVSENEKKICKKVEKINAIPSIDSWLVKYQHNLYSKTTGSDTNIKNIQSNHQYTNLPSLMPIVDVVQLKNITLNTWS